LLKQPQGRHQIHRPETLSDSSLFSSTGITMADTFSRFRKKYTLALLCWAAGSALAFYTKTDLTAYTIFSGTLLAIFGSADLIDKEKVGFIKPGAVK